MIRFVRVPVIPEVPDPDRLPTYVVAVEYTPENGQPLPDPPKFRVTTYSDIYKDARAIPGQVPPGDALLMPINDFMTQLSDEEQRKLWTFYNAVLFEMDRVGAVGVPIGDVANTIATLVKQICTGLRLPSRLIDYANSPYIPIPDVTMGPRKAHETDNMTFDPDHQRQLIAVSFLCKMLAPIWGEFICRTRKPVKLLDSSNQELFCHVMVAEVMQSSEFGWITEKLTNYANRTIDQQIKKAQSPTGQQQNIQFILSTNGFDGARLRDMILAVQFVKKLVLFDPWKQQDAESAVRPTIATHVYISITETLKSLISNLSRKMNIVIRPSATDNRKGSDNPDNASNMDVKSRISSIPIDIPIMVRVGMLLTVERFVDSEGLDRALYESAVEYYDRNPPEPSTFNIAITTSLWSKAAGGSSMMKHLTAECYCRILAATQLFLIKHGFVQLAHLLTCTTSNTMNLGMATAVMMRIQATLDRSPEYVECRSLFISRFLRPRENPYSRRKRFTAGRERTPDKITFEMQIDRLHQWITRYSHYYNTAPTITDFLGVSHLISMNTDLVYDELVIREICRFFLIVHPTAS